METSDPFSSSDICPTQSACGHASIRLAAPADAFAIIHIHHAAVHYTAAGHYTPEILEAWSRTPDQDRYEWMQTVINNDDAVVLVAERTDSIAGFGILILSSCELRALYVDPAAARKQIGQQLLQSLEACAIAQSITRLHLNASLNAHGFYVRNGYATVSSGVFRLSGTHEMQCIKMVKDVSSSQTNPADRQA